MRVVSPLVPAQGFTQRATIDPDLNEIHVLSVSIVFPDSVVYCNLTNVQIPGILQMKTGLSQHFHNSRDTFDLVMIFNIWRNSIPIPFGIQFQGFPWG